MMDSKICSKCKNEKSISEFSKDKGNRDGLSGQCKSCRKEWKLKNRENLLEYAKEYNKVYFDDKEAKEARTLRGREWRKNNPEKQRQYVIDNKETIRENKRRSDTKRLQESVTVRIAKNIRNRLRCILKGETKMGSAVKDLGCSTEELKLYLESKFQPGMTWENYGKGRGMNKWHIDHIIPLSSFDLTNREQFLKANHYTNLQPLWAIQNLQKSNKVA